MESTLKIAKKMEDKLIELMGREEYMKWSIAIAKEVFQEEVNTMPDSDFKNFCLENFDMITGETE